MGLGKKRSNPEAENEKAAPSAAELSDEDARLLESVQRDIARAELVLERRAQDKLASIYEKRREVTKKIKLFWSVALMNHPDILGHVQHQKDQLALSYLEDLWVSRDSTEPRCYALEFFFKENPFFSDSVLKKEFKLIPSPASATDVPDEDGITDSMLDFSWERDVQQSVQKIQWKDDSKNLTKLYPRQTDEVEDVADPGSFFNLFELEDDPFNIGTTIANELFPEAIEYFLGTAQDDLDSEDEDSEDDEDAEEIDLEKPRPKKQKKA